MYDLPAMRSASQALWSALAALLRRDGYSDLPDALGIDDESTSPGMIFTQTCGYPLQTIYRGQFQLLATPSYDAPGCDAMTHRAFIVVREEDPARAPEDLRGRRFAINSDHSNSGTNLPRHMLAPLARDGRFFGATIETGSHAASLALVQGGGADAASIDCVTWAFAGDYAPDLVSGLRVLVQTASSPALPFVTGVATPPALAAALQRALMTIGSDPAYRAIRAPLRLASIGLVPQEAYAILLRYEEEAVAAGYPRIA